MNSLFPLLDLWGNKNWPPSMKVEKMETFHNKCGLMGCKWFSLNTPGTETALTHPILKLDKFPFENCGIATSSRLLGTSLNRGCEDRKTFFRNAI